MYVKLFSSLYQGTLRGRSDEILVFTNLLAYADQHGFVDKHFKAIADETGLDAVRVEAAIAQLELPDPESRSPEMDGCRIVKMDEHRMWGWKIVNYGKYRAIRSEDDRREQNRLAQERWRNKQNNKQSKHNKPPSAQGEGEGEVKSTTPLAPDASRRGLKVKGKISFDFETGAFSGITEDAELRWQEAYPAIPIPPEILKAAAWLKANPKNRKSNYERFLIGWFSRNQDRAR